MEQLRVVELFSGYGSQSMALKRANTNFKTVAIAEIDEHAINSYEAIHGTTYNLGDITKVKGEDVPDHDFLTYSFPCFVSGTLVMTSKGLVPIENIKRGDEVLTHTNSFKKVVKPMINKANHIYRIKTMSSEDLFVTEEHPFYVRERYKVRNKDNGAYIRRFKKPEWVKTKDLTTNHFVGVAINKKEELPKWSGIKYSGPWGHTVSQDNLREIFDNPNFWWVVGRYMGDGWTREYKGTQAGGFNRHDERVIICCAKDELEEVTEVLDELKYFKYSVAKERTVYKIHIVDKEFTRFLYQFGKGAKNKRLTDSILNLPKYLLSSFLEGYESADGYVDKHGLHKISSISRELIYGVGQCIAKCYSRPYSIYKTKRNKTFVIEDRVVNQNDSYTVTYKPQKDVKSVAFYEDGYVWCPIRSVSLEPYNGEVYNMEVEDDNSYTANNIIVHNCTDISVSGAMKGLLEGSGTSSSTLWDVKRVIEAKKPRFLMMENVDNLVIKFKEDFLLWVNYLSTQGYTTTWRVIDADYYVPQRRKRVIAISQLDGKAFLFPKDPESRTYSLADVLEDLDDAEALESFKDPSVRSYTVDPVTYYNPNSDYYKTQPENSRASFIGYIGNQPKQATRVYLPITASTLTANGGGQGGKTGLYHLGTHIRNLTPLEAWRIMGVSDEDFYKAKAVGTVKTQLLKQAGNSIVVDIMVPIFEKLFKEYKKEVTE